MHRTERVVDYLIIGTGPSAIAAAMAFRRLGKKFEVIDVGLDLEPVRRAQADYLAARDPATWSAEARNTLFPAPKASSAGVEKRFAFGSDFPYRRPEPLVLNTENCIIDVSHGFGGFGSVWGATVLPFTDNDLVNWPLRASDLAPSYQHVASYVPISSAEDDLEQHFPRFLGERDGLAVSPQIQALAGAIERRKHALHRCGIWSGRSRVAVDTLGGATTCRYCGACLDGCVYGALFSPRRLWTQLEEDGVPIRRGHYALEFRESPNEVETVLIDLSAGSTRVVRSRRLFVGAGAINSTRLVARSLCLTQRPIRLLDSQYFFFPFLSYEKVAKASSFTLAELFLEVLNPRLGPFFTHFQVYGLNSIFCQAIRAVVPRVARIPPLLRQVEQRFYLFQGFLHSHLSGHLELTLEASDARKDRLKIRGVENPRSIRVARAAQRLIRKNLIGYGIVPPFYLKMASLGRSFHVGGSFPMGGEDPVFRSDRCGRPATLNRVHLLDAATFPSIPATTITFSIMANADRIVHETVQLMT
jgi:choline dehydrogenase-like flavoprotein